MKKLLLILVIGASFAACNNAGDSAAKPADSTAATVDTTAKMSADTTKKDTSAMAPAKDTAAKK